MSGFAKDTNVPTNDCISRQAAIDALIELSGQRDEWDSKEGFAQKRGIDAAICAIEDLPSEERLGRWVSQEYMSEIDSFIYTEYKCSNCGEISKKKSNFCLNCGAKMEEGEE